MELRLPELGEGITDATVVNVPVKPGQPVKAGDTVIEVETDKASMPIPADRWDHHRNACQAGDKIKVGAVIAVGGASRRSRRRAAVPLPSRPRHRPLRRKRRYATRREFTLPNLGEGIENGIIVAINVKPGDLVAVGQELFTIETDKASMPLPADADGRIEEVRVKQGDKVNIGAVLAVLSGWGVRPRSPLRLLPDRQLRLPSRSRKRLQSPSHLRMAVPVWSTTRALSPRGRRPVATPASMASPSAKFRGRLAAGGSRSMM